VNFLIVRIGAIVNSLCSSVKKCIWLPCLGVLLSIGLTGLFSLSAMAVELDFNVSAPTSGTISYDGTGNGLIGADIEVDNVVGTLRTRECR